MSLLMVASNVWYGLNLFTPKMLQFFSSDLLLPWAASTCKIFEPLWKHRVLHI